MDSDHRLLLRCTKPLLQSRNSAVCIILLFVLGSKTLTRSKIPATGSCRKLSGVSLSELKTVSQVSRKPKKVSRQLAIDLNLSQSFYETFLRVSISFQNRAARLRCIAWTCMERVFFILTVWPSKIEMKKHALHASPACAIARVSVVLFKDVSRVRVHFIIQIIF